MQIKASIFFPLHSLCSHIFPCSSLYLNITCSRAEASFHFFLFCFQCPQQHLPCSRCAVNICAVNIYCRVTNKAIAHFTLPGSEQLRFYCIFRERGEKNLGFQGQNAFLIQYVLNKGFTVMIQILHQRGNYNFLDKSRAQADRQVVSSFPYNRWHKWTSF